MTTSKQGMARMPTIIHHAPGDIKFRLLSLYWLARLVAGEGGTIIELGVRRGDTTRAFLAACDDCGAHLYSWDVEDVGDHVRQVTASYGLPEFRTPWTFYHESSTAGANAWASDVDLVFVDTDHTLATTREEIRLWSPCVRRGGCMVFHDYWLFDPPRDENQGRGVKMAVDEFIDRSGDHWTLETHDASGGGDTGLAILWRKK